MGLDFCIYNGHNVIKMIPVTYLRNNHGLFTNLLLEYTDHDTGVCKSDMFGIVIYDLKLQCITEIEKEIKDSDDTYYNFDFINNIRNKIDILEDKFKNRQYKNYYDMLWEMNENINKEIDRIYDATESNSYHYQKGILDDMNEIIDILEEYKNKDNICYALT